jgi:hypothetical protein
MGAADRQSTPRLRLLVASPAASISEPLTVQCRTRRHALLGMLANTDTLHVCSAYPILHHHMWFVQAGTVIV